MTIKKASKILNWWIEQKTRGIEKLQKEWVFSDDIHGVGKILLDANKTIVANLELIRKEIIPVQPPKENARCRF